MDDCRSNDKSVAPVKVRGSDVVAYAVAVRAICGVNAEMTRRTYGQVLGELIYRRRKGLGLTQTQLAVDAYGAAGKTRRISELENGLVGNPHPKTIDPVIVVLGIKDAELEECARSVQAEPDAPLDKAYREARELIDRVAREFEISLPDATLSQVDAFLREKAREWIALKGRIQDIEFPDTEISNIKERASGALAAGDFALVDELLSNAEEIQQSSGTLREVRKQAKIRIARADACLLDRKNDRALEFYIKAAEYFIPFDEMEAVEVLQGMAWRLYESSKRLFDPHYMVAARILERALRLPQIEGDAEERGRILYRLGLIYRSEFAHYIEDRKFECLDFAILYSRESIKLLSSSEDLFTLFSAKVSLANCLHDQGRTSGGAEELGAAISLLREARIGVANFEDGEHLLPVINNSLGSAILHLMELDDKVSVDKLDEAYEVFKTAIENGEKSLDIDAWSAAQINRGRILFKKSKIENENIYKSSFLRIQALSAVISANEATPQAAYPLRSGEISRLLGDIFYTHSTSQDQNLLEIYLARAISAYEAAASVFSQDGYPKDWARIQYNMGRAFTLHAKNIGGECFEDDLELARKHFLGARDAFEASGMPDEMNLCVEALQKVSEIAASGDPSGNAN